MKRILSIFLALICIISLSSCNKKTPTLMDYNDVYVDISLDVQKEMEKAFNKQFDRKIKWCMPYETDSFKSLNSFENYLKSNYGLRPYGKIGNKIVLFYFYSTDNPLESVWPTTVFYTKYKDKKIVNGLPSIWQIVCFDLYIYENNNFEKYSMDIDLETLNASEEEAENIKNNFEHYIEKYFSKFMNESDLNLDDAFNRIVAELKK